jgi:hypothetical protein
MGKVRRDEGCLAWGWKVGSEVIRRRRGTSETRGRGETKTRLVDVGRGGSGSQGGHDVDSMESARQLVARVGPRWGGTSARGGLVAGWEVRQGGGERRPGWSIAASRGGSGSQMRADWYRTG